MFERKKSSLIPESKTEENPLPAKLSFLTFNIGCLPLGGKINSAFLRPNKVRAEYIIDKIIAWNKNPTDKAAETLPIPDVLCFQEAFEEILPEKISPDIRSLLKKKLAPYYPYNSDHLGQRLRGSGLLLLSKKPITEEYFREFDNIMVGSDQLAIKGYLGVKLAVDDNYFISVFTTHLESGAGILKDRQAEKATTSWRRGEQMALIYRDMQIWGTKPPIREPDRLYLKTFVMGDFNVGLNDKDRMLSISTGKSATNGYPPKAVKYPGQEKLFTLLEHTVPENFIEVRRVTDAPKGKKVRVPEWVEKAIKESKFIGSYLPVKMSKDNKDHNVPIYPYNADPKIIDGIFCSLDGQSGKFTSRIVSFNFDPCDPKSVKPSLFAASDHFPMEATFEYSLFKKSPGPGESIKSALPAEDTEQDDNAKRLVL